LHLALTKTLELDHTDKDVFPPQVYKDLSNKARIFILCEKKPA